MSDISKQPDSSGHAVFSPRLNPTLRHGNDCKGCQELLARIQKRSAEMSERKEVPEWIRKCAEEIEEDAINWADRFFDHDESEKIIAKHAPRYSNEAVERLIEKVSKGLSRNGRLINVNMEGCEEALVALEAIRKERG